MKVGSSEGGWLGQRADSGERKVYLLAKELKAFSFEMLNPL